MIWTEWRRRSVCVLFLGCLASSGLAGPLPDDPRQVEHKRLLTSTKSKADFAGDGVPEVVVLVNAITGEKTPERATEVAIAIAGPDVGNAPGPLLWARQVMRDTGQPAHDGEFAAVDLDGDGASELIVTYDRSVREHGVERWCEIYTVRDPVTPRRVWDGVIERDARRDPLAKLEDRVWVRWEIDYPATRREAGKAIVFTTKRSGTSGAPQLGNERIEVPLRAYSSR
jgi:hypothetical protein